MDDYMSPPTYLPHLLDDQHDLGPPPGYTCTVALPAQHFFYKQELVGPDSTPAPKRNWIDVTVELQGTALVLTTQTSPSSRPSAVKRASSSGISLIQRMRLQLLKSPSQSTVPSLSRGRSDSNTSSVSITVADAQDNTLSSSSSIHRSISLHLAEVGIAKDYFKRDNVLRIRAEGGQFLLAAPSFDTAALWIDRLDTAIRIASPIDSWSSPRYPRLSRSAVALARSIIAARERAEKARRRGRALTYPDLETGTGLFCAAVRTRSGTAGSGTGSGTGNGSLGEEGALATSPTSTASTVTAPLSIREQAQRYLVTTRPAPRTTSSTTNMITNTNPNVNARTNSTTNVHSNTSTTVDAVIAGIKQKRPAGPMSRRWSTAPGTRYSSRGALTIAESRNRHVPVPVPAQPQVQTRGGGGSSSESLSRDDDLDADADLDADEIEAADAEHDMHMHTASTDDDEDDDEVDLDETDERDKEPLKYTPPMLASSVKSAESAYIRAATRALTFNAPRGKEKRRDAEREELRDSLDFRRTRQHRAPPTRSHGALVARRNVVSRARGGIQRSIYLACRPQRGRSEARRVDRGEEIEDRARPVSQRSSSSIVEAGGSHPKSYTSSSRNMMTQSPQKKRGGMTLARREALVENLRAEERARKLRAQYSLQAAGLRTRLELRVHRIPTALRKVTIGELLERYALQEQKQTQAQLVAGRIVVEKTRATGPAAVEIEEIGDTQDQAVSGVDDVQGHVKRGFKRTRYVTTLTIAHKLHSADGRHSNAISSPQRPITNAPATKRVRTNTGAAAAGAAASSGTTTAPALAKDATRPAPQRAMRQAPPQVLSPRSHNSRTPSKALAAQALALSQGYIKPSTSSSMAYVASLASPGKAALITSPSRAKTSILPSATAATQMQQRSPVKVQVQTQMQTQVHARPPSPIKADAPTASSTARSRPVSRAASRAIAPSAGTGVGTGTARSKVAKGATAPATATAAAAAAAALRRVVSVDGDTEDDTNAQTQDLRERESAISTGSSDTTIVTRGPRSGLAAAKGSTARGTGKITNGIIKARAPSRAVSATTSTKGRAAQAKTGIERAKSVKARTVGGAGAGKVKEMAAAAERKAREVDAVGGAGAASGTASGTGRVLRKRT
ncbi:hypothetical protein MRB53_038266 [Persea americana]|nr:hypothetical protein MRB53_038266 [Persea americana]